MTQSTFTIEQLVLPDSVDSPDAGDFLQLCELTNVLIQAAQGSLDLATPNGARLTMWQESPYHRLEVFFIRCEGRIVARAWIHFPRQENLDTAWLGLGVHPDFEGRGMGRALAEHLETVALSHGRTVVQTGTEHSVGADEESGERLRPGTGSGSVPLDSRAVRFALARGYVLEQVERTSMLVLAEGTLGETRLLLESAAGRAEGAYELVSWLDEAPEEFLEDLARLSTSMSTEIPLGGLELGEEAFDAERVREMDERRRSAGTRAVTTAARHRATGALAGYSVLEYVPENPEVGHQDNTLVLPDHRGHALGQWMKAENLLRLVDAFPAVRRIYTYNANENDHMLAINTAMGFRPAGYDGQWQCHLVDRPAIGMDDGKQT
ncbi:GNAT family N-acetyltransferase [Arthrobacter sp. NPDC090010]|uniref:GNAT family N-acetyltransferase n=1 Tax=Arthrobacter sp. NPDC090010 TaxID=3363942 RepID=UPI00381B4B4D